jgi:biopolymer transport protein ExbD
MRGRRWLHHDTTGEFELDLAPLLAVMVKLVPVLLVSSAFVQLMVVETQLPQVVQEAIQQDNEKPLAQIRLQVDPRSGMKIIVAEKGVEKETDVPLKDGGYNYAGLHQALISVKKAYPSVYKLDLVPSGAVPYGDLVKVMDEARRSRDAAITFPVLDKAIGAETQTPFMFPEVVFANSLEGA